MHEVGGPSSVDKLQMPIRSTSPSLVFISETKLRGQIAERLKQSVGFNNGLIVDCVRHSGGLYLLWSDETEVDRQSFSKHGIDVFVKLRGGPVWRFKGIYGVPDRSQQNRSWELLRRLKGLFTLSWLIGGDFKEILSASEKLEGSDKTSTSIRQFWEAVLECNIVDLGCERPPLTWNNHHDLPNNVQERLNRYLGDDAWTSLFPEFKVSNLDFFGSDHLAVKISLFRFSTNRGVDARRNFIFLFYPIWMTSGEFKEVVWSSWFRPE